MRRRPQREPTGEESIWSTSFALENVPPIVDDVIRLGIPYLWLQDEVMHDEAVARARAAGVKCVQNDCIFREHAARQAENSKSVIPCIFCPVN